MSNLTIGEMINTAIIEFEKVRGKEPTLLVLNRLAYVALLAHCVDMNRGAPMLGEPGSPIETIEDMYMFRGMEMAVLQAPVSVDANEASDTYTVRVMVH